MIPAKKTTVAVVPAATRRKRAAHGHGAETPGNALSVSVEEMISELREYVLSRGPIPPDQSFVDLLRTARLEIGLTQAGMDKALDVSGGTTAFWETDRNTPRILTQEGVVYRIYLLLEKMGEMRAVGRVPQLPPGREGPRFEKYKKRRPAPEKGAARKTPANK